ncbi:MAG: methyltransferase domain-containing protein [Bacteroidales bacterium]|nr:methyltransferase domain-containing protein [Bacteroidales bacterium]
MRKLIKLLLKYIPRPFLIKMSMLFNKPVSLFYKGNSVECTVCNKHFKKFMPYGYGVANKSNRLCPNCLSLERHRLLWLYFQNKTDLFKEEKVVLHMAPEQPFIKRFKKFENLNYTTADLFSPIADVKTDIRNMDFKDSSFDVFICNHVMEHIDEEQKALKEVLRILKPKGWAILQVPIDYSLEKTFEDDTVTDKKEREKIFGQYDHVRLYGKDYSERLRKAGFKVIEDDFVKTFSDEEIKRYRFDKNEIIYLCVKE